MAKLAGSSASVWLTGVVLLAAAQGCTSQPVPSVPESSTSVPSATSSPVTTAPTTATTPSSTTSEPSATSAAETTPVTVPAEATALPLPADDTRVDALNPQEQADRAAIEAVWRRVWDLVPTVNNVPAADRAALVDALMVDPIRTQLLGSATSADEKGSTIYGSVTLHPYWYRAVDGLPYAVIGDCRDASQFGSADRSTGEKKSVGTKDNNTVGKFVKTADGTWKLFDIVYVQDVPCTVG